MTSDVGPRLGPPAWLGLTTPWAIGAPAGASTADRRIRAYSLGAMFVAGNVLGLIVVLWMPEVGRFRWASIVTVASGIALGLAILAFGRRLPASAFHFLVAGATVFISLGVFYGNGSGIAVAIATFYVWMGLYAAFFFYPLAVAAHMALAGVAYGVATSISGSPTAAAEWALVMGVSLVGTAMLAWMSHQIRAFAGADGLTGLPNRQTFSTALAREIARAERERTALCIAMIDLDDFKDVNDNHGHQTGDSILAGLPRTWRPLLREIDVLARYGGDEFVVILPLCGLAEAELVLRRLLDAGGPACSIGIAQWAPGDTDETLLGHADRALYQAKRSESEPLVAAA